MFEHILQESEERDGLIMMFKAIMGMKKVNRDDLLIRDDGRTVVIGINWKRLDVIVILSFPDRRIDWKIELVVRVVVEPWKH